MIDLPLSATKDDEVEIVLCDVGVARAFWEGVSAARLLARARLERDERDVVDAAERATGEDVADSSWDTLMARLLAHAPASHERVKRAVARHTRAASDEGPLAASDASIAALVHVLLSAIDPDASPAEGAAEAQPVDEAVRSACATLDARLARADVDRRATAFEACLRLASSAATEPAPLGAIVDAVAGIVAASAPLYPWGDSEVLVGDRRACLLERADLERALQRGPRGDGDGAPSRARRSALGSRIAHDAARLLARPGAVVAFVVAPPRPQKDAPPVPPSSWLPSDFAARDAAQRVAAALERGATTVPRARAVVARGGDAALDAIGKEMLEVAAHPFASAVFAEVLGAAGRERDVVRLVTYFAIAPDPSAAARALSLSSAPDVATVLRAWLESMLPSDGGAASRLTGPEAPGSRLAACLAALAPYPQLYDAVRPLLARVSDAPPPQGDHD